MLSRRALRLYTPAVWGGRRTVLCPKKVELRSFHGDLCISFLHVVVDATESFSRSRMLRTSAPGWFKQGCPFSAKPRRHQTALRAQANSCSHEPTALSPLSLQGVFGNVASQKPLRATCRPSKAASSILER